MSTVQILPIIMGVFFALHLIPGIIYWIYIPKLAKCAPNHTLRSVTPLINLLMGFLLLIFGGISRQYVLTIVLLIINLGAGLFFEYKFIIQAKPTHTWNGCKCTKCGVIDPSRHEITKETCKCKTCQGTFHEMDGCVCRNCGKTIHQSSAGSCKCNRCGQDFHHFVQGRCVDCGKIIAGHKHVYKLIHGIVGFYKETDLYRCEICGETAVGFALDNPDQ